MKSLIISLFGIILILGTIEVSYGQELCDECQCEVEEAGEDADVSADIGGESGEMGLSEGDMLGSEVGSEIGGDVGAEVGEEITVEMGTLALGDAALDALPGVGEVAMLAQAGIFLYFLIEDIEHLERDFEDHVVGSILHGGTFKAPSFPSFTISAHDLNGKRDTVSYLFFMKKRYGEDDVLDYLERIGENQHVGKTYALDSLSPGMQYAFSAFTGHSGYSDPNATKIPVTYEHYVPEINLSVDASNQLQVQYKAKWQHDQQYEVTSKEVRDEEGTIFPDEFVFEVQRKLNLKTHYAENVTGEVEFWLATRNGDKTVNYEVKIPPGKVHVEDQGDYYAIRIKELNINNSYINSSSDLFVALRVPYRKPRVTKTAPGGSIQVFPENWNPSSPSTQFSLELSDTYLHPLTTSDDPANAPPERNFTTTKAVDFYSINHDNPINNVYSNTLGRRPEIKYENLIFFQVHDYQPRDTESSASTKIANGETENVNLFPVLHATGKVEYTNNNIGKPLLGRTHLQVDIPHQNGLEDIEYIELKGINKKISIILTQEKDQLNASRFRLKGVLRTDEVSDVRIPIWGIASGEDGTETLLKTAYPDSVAYVDAPNSAGLVLNSFLLINVPFEPGDIVDINAYYASTNRLSRQVVKIPIVENNFIERDYFTFRNGTRNLQLRHGLVSDPAAHGHWMVELQGNNLYSIVNRATGQVLGFDNGEYGIYPWNPLNEGLYWNFAAKKNVFESSISQLVQLYNVGQKGYLNLSDDGVLGVDFEAGIELQMNRVSAVEEYLSEEDSYFLVTSGSEEVVDRQNMNEVLFSSRHSLDHTDQKLQFLYTGSFTYAIRHTQSGYYLNYSQGDGLHWSSTTASPLLLWGEGLADGHYRVSVGDKYLARDPDGKAIAISKSEIATQGYQTEFKILQQLNAVDLVLHYAMDGSAMDNSLYSQHGTAYDGVSFVEDIERGLVASFDGVDDYIDTNVDLNLNSLGGAMTASAWIKTKEWGGAYARIFDASSWSMARSYLYDGVRLYSYRPDGAFYWIGDSESNYIQGENWNHVTVTMKTLGDSSIYREIYVNGELEHFNTVSHALRDSGLSTLLGKAADTDTKNFRGFMDDIKVWRKALTPDEVQIEFESNQKVQELILHYDVEGNFSDSSPYDRDGEVSGVSYFKDSQRGDVAYFDGSGNYVDTGFDFHPDDYAGTLTATAWMKTSDWGGQYARIFDADSWSLTRDYNRAGIRLYSYHNNTDGTFYFSTSDAEVGDGMWHHVAAVFRRDDSGQLKRELYVDGQLEKTVNVNLSRRNRSINTLIGKAAASSTKNYKGYMDDLRIYKSGMTPEEIQAVYQASRIEDDIDPIAIYAFEDNTEDTSGNGHHGVSYNSFSFVNDGARGKVAAFGSDGYVNTQTEFNPSAYDEGISIGLWVKNKAGSADNPTLLAGENYYIEKNGSKISAFGRVSDPLNGPGYRGLTTSSELAEETWYHLIYVIDKSGDEIFKSLYVNGELETTSTIDGFYELFADNSQVTQTLLGVNIGRDSSEFFDGNLDDVKIWDKVLSESEARRVYNREEKGETSSARIASVEVEDSEVLETEESELETPRVYPTLANGKINIEFSLSSEQVVSYLICTYAGKTLKNGNKKFGKGNHLWTVDIKDIPKGVYKVVTTSDRKSTFRIVKQ